MLGLWHRLELLGGLRQEDHETKSINKEPISKHNRKGAEKSSLFGRFPANEKLCLKGGEKVHAPEMVY